MLLTLSRVCTSAKGLIILAACSLSTSAMAEQAPPQIRLSPQPAIASPVIGIQPYRQTMQRLRVVRAYHIEDIRANPQVTLGAAQLDFRPMLANPKALFNVAARLHTLGQVAEVRTEGSDITEVAQGLVIHHTLEYRILPGQCERVDARVALARAGVNCFGQGSIEQHIAAFSAPGSPRYIADPGQRGKAVASYRQQEAAIDADATAHIAQLRRMLVDPAQRATIAAAIGAIEAARIAALSDDELKGYLINAGVQHHEETAFVPRLDAAVSGTSSASPAIDAIAARNGEAAAEQQLLGRGAPDQPLANYPKLLRIMPRSAFHTLGHTMGNGAQGGDQVTDIDLGTYTYLTGFTLGHDYEWSYNFSITINWCVVGCSSTYSITPHAGFNYGFGLRFPIQASLKYHNVVHGTGGAETTVTPSFAPIEGAPNEWTQTGLSQELLFNDQELVAQVGADAGVAYNLPVIGSGNPNFSVEVDFTQILPPPYQGGRFKPPTPGDAGINSPYVFNQIDLLGDLLNFGAFGVQIFPAVNINLHSNALTFQLKDEVSGRINQISHSGQAINLATDPGHNNDSRFDFANPTYNLGFTLTPGIDPHLFLDLAVWSLNWDPTIWFPQLAVDLPPHGIDFGCHSGTTCNIDFPWPKALVTSGNALEAQLVALGCSRSGSMMNCTTVPSYSKCQPAVSAHQILGIQSCNPGLLEKELVTADHTLGGGGCVKGAGERLHFPDGDFGAYAYACPIKKGDQGMLGLCNTMRGNGVVLSCDVLVPAVTDQILKRGGCNGGTPSGVYACPSGMMALCNQFVNVGGVILACQALPPRGAENGSATMKNPRLVAYRAGLDPLRVLPAITRSHDVGWS